MMAVASDGYVSVAEAAGFFGKSRTAIRDWIRRGLLKVKRDQATQRIFIPRSELDARRASLVDWTPGTARVRRKAPNPTPNPEAGQEAAGAAAQASPEGPAPAAVKAPPTSPPPKSPMPAKKTTPKKPEPETAKAADAAEKKPARDDLDAEGDDDL